MGCPAGSWGWHLFGYRGDSSVQGGQGAEKGDKGVIVEASHGSACDLLDFWEHPVQHVGGRGGDVDQDAAAVSCVGEAPDETVAFECVEHAGHRPAGDVHPCADFAYRYGPTVAFDDGQGVEGGVRQPVAAGHAGDEGFGVGADHL